MINNRKSIKLKSVIINYIINNKKEYLIMLILFIIGLFLGVLYINNIKDDQFNNISNYINNFVEKLKGFETIDTGSLLKTSIIQNLLLVVSLWFFGTTVIRNSCSVWNCNI